MPRAQLVICLDSEWLIAGGESTLGTADMAPMRDVEGLPTIPGRTLRGLLREAVSLIDDCERSAHTQRIFGTRKSATDTANEGDGTLRVSNALLIDNIAKDCNTTDARAELFATIRRTALNTTDARADLFATIRRTALNTATRSAKTGSLREMEVAIAGLELVADLECATDFDLQLLAFAAGLVRSLGHSRSRGLGRCHLEMWRDGKQVRQTEIPTGATQGATR